MPAPNLDIVFVIDASESMQPCFDELSRHLDAILQPMQGYISKVRYGLVAQSAGSARGQAIYDHQFLCGSGIEALQTLYRKGPNDPDPGDEFFTADARKFTDTLAAVKPKGNEEMLVALDVAADLPFGPLSNTKRVIAFFSDEPFEDGVSEGKLNPRIPELIKKIQDRHIQLFVAVPDGEAAQQLAMADRSEVELVDGGSGLGSVDFKRLLGQMGKSISGSALQVSGEPSYARALFGQDGWGAEQAVSAANRDVVLDVGEAATLDTSQPIENILVRMNWTAAIDLDLHAFFRLRDGSDEQVYFGNMREGDVYLDHDAGVGREAGNNEENIVVTTLDNILEVLFAVHNFSGDGRFCDYDGRVFVEPGNGDRVTVPLTAQERGFWCVIARINNQDPAQPKVVNVNRVTNDEPSLEDYV